jgi:hypothetical protein
MPKLSFSYQGFFRLLNRFRSKANFKTAKPRHFTSNQVVNNINFNVLQNELPSRFTISVTGRRPGLRPFPTPGTASPLAQTPVARSCTPDALERYLDAQGNLPVDIAKLEKLMAMPQVLLEIGCGACKAALEIALKNPDWAVIATDVFAWDVSPTECSHYQKLAQEWKAKRLDVQQNIPENLAVLRAEAEILHYLPDRSIDSVLLVNPEPLVGRALLDLLADPAVYAKIKPGNSQIVIVPFSREMGVVACGGYEFDHVEDWSKGLGFIKSSAFEFRRADKVQWGVDLRGSSPYSKNSTQAGVYLYGSHP